MTRQKKELIKKIDSIQRFIWADEELGCGFAPAGFYDPLYKQINELETELAHIRHYATAEDMMYDPRCMVSEGIPF